MPTIIEAIKADITTVKIDATVNAANSSLLGGGGVDGAIHKAAGNELLQQCRLLGGCKTGEAKLTDAFSLPAKKIIHTVGPVWRGGENSEREQLQQCYENCMRLANEYELGSIAFPAISTGVFGFPVEEATEIAVNTIWSLTDNGENSVKHVIFCCYSDADLEIYQRKLQAFSASKQ